MTRPLDRLAESTQQQYLFVIGKTSDFGTLISTWLLVGNAGGLGLAMSAVLAGTRCDPWMTQRSVQAFALGVLLAFGSALVAYAVTAAGALKMSKMAVATQIIASNDFLERELEAAGVDVPADSPLVLQADEAAKQFAVTTAVRWLYAGFGFTIVLYLASAIAFGVGALTPTLAEPASFRSCIRL